MFQSTPAAFHGRPDLAHALTEELRGAAAEAPRGHGAAAAAPSRAMSGVGNTARWIAASRAKESELALPLFSDPCARELSGEAGFELQRSMRAAMGAQGDGPDLYLSIRTKFLDDALCRRCDRATLHQVVILAAGMDTRAFRIPWPSGVKVFEVDRDEIFDHKEAVLGACTARRRRASATSCAPTWRGRGPRRWPPRGSSARSRRRSSSKVC